MGSPEFAVPSLQVCHDVCTLTAVVCQPDRPAGRGRKITPPPVKRAAVDLGLEVIQPTKMRDGTLAQALNSRTPDVIVVVAFGRILPADILRIPAHGCINVHASLLPRWRGAAPIARAILAGDEITGVSIMQMDEGLDTGPVFSRSQIAISPEETAGELSRRLSQLGSGALREFLTGFAERGDPQAQDHSNATAAPPLRKEEGRTRWDRSAAEVVNHIRGMDPWPGAFTTRGDQRLGLFTATPSPVTVPGTAPGTVVSAQKDGMVVACASGCVRIAEVQPANRRRMPAAAYAAGQAFEVNERLGMPIETAG